MKRRGFLKLLGLLPFAPALAKSINMKQVARVANIDLASGADSSSFWLVNWSDRAVSEYGEALGVRPSILDVAKSHKWNGLPVIEALSQKNPLLQDMVWQEKNIQLGHNFLKARTTEQYKKRS